MALGAALVLAVVLPASASAAFPGSNGRVAFELLLAHGSELVTAEASGRALRVVVGAGLEPTGPAWSPDGKTIAFAGAIGPGSVRRSAIFLVRPGGRGLRQLTTPPAGAADQEPGWSPSGREIVFVRSFPSPIAAATHPFGPQLHVVRADASGPPRLIVEHGRSPAWSPDGRAIAFVTERDAGPASLHTLAVARSDGSGRRALTGSGSHQQSSPDWSADGQRLVFADAGRIVSISRSGGDRRELTTGTPPDSDPVFSPDGRSIAFVRDFLTGGAQARRLMIMRADGSGQRVLLAGRFGALAPTWQALP